MRCDNVSSTGIECPGDIELYDETWSCNFCNTDYTEDYDGAPWCHQCGAQEEKHCDCGPMAANH
jgi:hypothetical protein